MKTQTMISRALYSVCWLLVGCMVLLFSVAPAQAQKATLSLKVENEATATPLTSRTDLHQRLASHTTLRNTGKKAVNASVVTMVFQDGQPVGAHVTDPFILNPGARMELGSQRLPEADFFPSSDGDDGGASLTIQGWGEWVTSWAPWNWFSGDDEAPSKVDCSLGSTNYAGCSPAQCERLPFPQRNQCYAAGGSLVGEATSIPTTGTVVVVAVVPLAEPGKQGGNEPVRVQGIMLSAQ